MLEEARSATRRKAFAVVARRHGGQRREYAHRDVTMVRTVIHDMRSPLTAIKAYSSTMLAQKVRLSIRETKEVLARIESSRSGTARSELMTCVLRFSKRVAL